MSTILVNQFDGGMVSDPRDPRQNVCRSCQHFDAFTNKHRLTPYRSTENGDSSAATNLIGNFEYDGTTIFGLGVNGSSQHSVYTRTNFTDATWTYLINNPGSTLTNADYALFVFYRTTGKLYGVRGGRYVWTVTPSGPAANNAEQDLSAYTTVSNGIVHSKDDILYFGYDNKIAKCNNGSWTTPALTLPTDYVITSVCEYGNYLAIGCRAKSGTSSRVYLWDRDSSLATLSETIDWGEGNLMCLEQLEGNLIGISFEGTTGSYNTNTRTVFRYYAGAQGALKFAELQGYSTTPPIQSSLFKQKAHGRIFFAASIPIVSTPHTGIWSIGRSSVGAPFGITLERLYNNGSSFGTSLTVSGFILLGDYAFQSYNNGSATWQTEKTDDAATFSATSVYETTINPNMPPLDRIQRKQLVSVGATYDPLPSGAQVVVKYRVEGGSWLTIFTETTAGVVRTEPYTRAALAQFTAGMEYEFRIESTGGAVITGLLYKYNPLASNV